MSFLRKLSRFLQVVTENIGAIFMFMVTVLLFSQVFMRTFLQTNFPWAEEVARLFMIWIAMLGGSLLVKDNDLISVDFLDPLMPAWLKRYREVFISLLLFWLFSMLAYEGLLQAHYGRNVSLSSIRISMFWPYLAIPVGSILIIFHYFVNTCEKFAGSKEVGS